VISPKQKEALEELARSLGSRRGTLRPNHTQVARRIREIVNMRDRRSYRKSKA